MKSRNTLVHMLAVIALTAVVVPSAAADASPGFWGHFDRDVATVSTRSMLDEVVLDYTDADGLETLLLWADGASSFDLTWEDHWISDLVTYEDANGNMAFEGLYVEGSPTLNGYVEVNADGTHSVYIDPPAGGAMWYIADGAGTVATARVCKCGNGPQECNSNERCNQGKLCTFDANRTCTWHDVVITP